MTPNQRHNRRLMIYLLMISTAIFALSLSEKMRKERDSRVVEAPDYVEQIPKSFEEGARVVIPREIAPPPASKGAVEPEEEAGLVDTSLQGGLPAPTSFLAGVELQEAFAYTMRESVTEDIMECLNAWWLLEPAIEGRVELEVVLDKTGLKEAAVVDHAQVPFGPLTCFATALYRTQWPASSDGEVVILVPVVFSNALVAPQEEADEGAELGALGEDAEDSG